MGSPISAVVANLYMEFFEELALETAPTRPCRPTQEKREWQPGGYCPPSNGDQLELYTKVNSVNKDGYHCIIMCTRRFTEYLTMTASGSLFMKHI